jgi:hypothetical protein
LEIGDNDMPLYKFVNGEKVEMSQQEAADFISIRDSIGVTESMVRAEGARRMRAIVSEYTDEERETWMQQIEEANNGGGPLLNALAEARGLTNQQMCDIIIGKREAYLNALSLVLGSQSKLILMDPIPKNYTDNSYWE